MTTSAPLSILGRSNRLADEDGVDGDRLLAGSWGVDGGEAPGRDVEAQEGEVAD